MNSGELSQDETACFRTFQEKTLQHNFLPITRQGIIDAFEAQSPQIDLKSAIIDNIYVSEVNISTQEIVQSIVRRQDMRLNSFVISIERELNNPR